MGHRDVLTPLELHAVRQARDFVAWCLGERLQAFLLCGPRARGDPDPDADIEMVAVVAGDGDVSPELVAEEEDLRDAVAETLELADLTAAFALVTEGHLARCRGHALCASARREGRPL